MNRSTARLSVVPATPYGDHCRKRDAIQAVRDRYYAKWQKLCADMEDEIRRIERGE